MKLCADNSFAQVRALVNIYLILYYHMPSIAAQKSTVGRIYLAEEDSMYKSSRDSVREFLNIYSRSHKI